MSELDLEIVRLEQTPDDPELIGNIFRLVHTIKGTCGFLGLPRLETVAHAGENVLGRIRDNEIDVTPGVVSLILAALDRIQGILLALEETEAEPEGDDSELIAMLNVVADGGAAPEDRKADTQPSAEAEKVEEAEPEVAEEVDELQAIFDAAEYKGPGEVVNPADLADEAKKEEAGLPATESDTGMPVSANGGGSGQLDGGATGAPRESSVASQSIRVNVDLLENLMTMVSELVLTRNQLLQILRAQQDSEFAAPLQRLSHVTTELQEGVMKTRMQPIGNAWAKLPRIIRDLAVELDKKVDLQMVGADTELDRQVLELIKDPLTHMVRNSADHGIEMPAERKARGKSETGTISLNAYHEGGHIVIEVADDGAGLNVGKIKEKIIRNGLATDTELEGMSDQQIQQFVFRAGFSTATEVTAVSGRGVGMDVVRSNIEKIGGNIELVSQEGNGTTFLIKIPLTLAIVSALIIECAEERFAIPQISVLELVRAGNHSEHTIERIQGTPVLRLRNSLLPLVSLRDILHVGEGSDIELSEDKETFVIVTQVGNYTFGTIVDRVFDTEEIVVKPVAPVLRNISYFSGNTILGDGSVIMILDPNGLAGQAGEMAIGEQLSIEQKVVETARDDDREALLVFKAGDNTPKVVPLGLIARLEEIDGDKVETSNGRKVIHYRGSLMPLVTISDAIEIDHSGRKPALVFTENERSMALVVDEIIDIVEDRMVIELGSERPGCLGSAYIADATTDVIDTSYYLNRAYGDWFRAETAIAYGQESGSISVLLVDDSSFFRNLMAPVLSVAGFDVTTASSGDEAMTLCERGLKYDIIVSDIEMPGMDGFAFAAAVRASESWRNTPMVALSVHQAMPDLERGRAAGFNDYVAKFDRNALLSTLTTTLAAFNEAEVN
jgi:two-component system chemotaxis sensor kinase CheA